MNPNTPGGLPPVRGADGPLAGGQAPGSDGPFLPPSPTGLRWIYTAAPPVEDWPFSAPTFSLSRKNMCRWSRNQQTWTPPPSTFPVRGSWSNARSAARSIPVTMPFAPCAGPGGISPAPGAENGFRQHSRSVPGAATAEMRNKRNRQAAAMETHGRRCFSAQKKHSTTYRRVPALFTSRYSRLRSSVGCAAVKPRQSEKSGRWSAGTASRSRISVTGTLCGADWRSLLCQGLLQPAVVRVCQDVIPLPVPAKAGAAVGLIQTALAGGELQLPVEAERF